MTWSFPSQLGVISAYLSIIAFILSILFYFLPYSHNKQVELPVLPNGSGWLLLGDYDEIKKKYIRGPFYEVVSSNYNDKSKFPRKGEILKILKERNLIIVNYKTSGVKNLYKPPWQENFLENNDYTGIKIKSNHYVEVRDISLGSFPNMPIVVWVRVGEPPKE